MKFSDTFSDAAVLKRSQEATRALDVAARSAKVKKELDHANMEKKERRPLKEFADLRTELNEEVVQENTPHNTLPPNILILRRKTVRQFPNNVMVALYYNDKLNQYFSIPYGGNAEGDKSVITPVTLKEAEETLNEISIETAKRAYHARQKRGEEALAKGDYKTAVPHFMKATKTIGHRANKFSRAEKGEVVREETYALHHGPIGQLRSIRDNHQMGMVTHKDGSNTQVDATTAHALLTVHAALHPDNQKKFSDALEHSHGKLKKMSDFAFSQVK